MKSPTPKQVKKSRTEAELIQTLTAQLIYKGLRIWQGWETPVGEKGHRKWIMRFMNCLI